MSRNTSRAHPVSAFSEYDTTRGLLLRYRLRSIQFTSNTAMNAQALEEKVPHQVSCHHTVTHTRRHSTAPARQPVAQAVNGARPSDATDLHRATPRSSSLPFFLSFSFAVYAGLHRTTTRSSRVFLRPSWAHAHNVLLERNLHRLVAQVGTGVSPGHAQIHQNMAVRIMTRLQFVAIGKAGEEKTNLSSTTTSGCATLPLPAEAAEHPDALQFLRLQDSKT